MRSRPIQLPTGERQTITAGAYCLFQKTNVPPPSPHTYARGAANSTMQSDAHALGKPLK